MPSANRGLGKGLGKGLDSMIPDKHITSKKEDNVSRETLLMDINKIEPNRNQPRQKFNDDTLNELADSIKQMGVIQPLIIRKKGKMYEIIAGERRWRASKIAGIKQVPVIIKDYTEKEVMEIALIENIQREDLNPIEEAEAYQNLITEYNLKQDELAERVSKSRTAITNSLRLLKLCDDVRQMVMDERISSGHARTLIPLEDEELQKKIALQIMDEKLSVRDTEALVKKILNQDKEKKKEKKKIENEFLYRNYEQKFTEALGVKVSISPANQNKGKIEIKYSSMEEFEDIMEKIINTNE